MKAILIDPVAETVMEVEHNGNYKQIQSAIGADCFTTIQIDENNTLYVDDEGLLHGCQDFFILPNYGQPLAGKGLILGTDEEGESMSTTLDVASIRDCVRFEKLHVARIEHDTREGVVMGRPGTIISHNPVFNRVRKGDYE